jgi:hypothetical protein
MFALLGLAPNVVAWNYAVAQTTDGAEQAPCIVVVREPGEAGTLPENFEWVGEDGKQHIKIVAQAAGGDGNGQEGEIKVIQRVCGPNAVEGDVVVTADVQATGDGPGGHKVKQIKVIAKPKADDPDAAQRGWLGVSIMAVPESMSAQMGAQGRGIMVGNVVTDSPADKAGIQANDVIVSLNGEVVSGDVGPAVDLIKARKPGETVNVGVLRGGQPMTLKVTLGSRAGLATDHMKNFNWKFEGMPAHVEEQIKTRGKFMMKTPDGELIIKDLGELDDLKNLPHNIRMFVPQAGTRSAQVTVENGQKTIRLNVVKDGSTLGIEQDDGGPITVRRSDDGGQETVATYDNADALKAADQDAYELYSQAGQGVFVHTDGDGDAQHIVIQGDGDFDWTGDAGQWKVHLEESLAEAKEAYAEAMEELHANLMELKNQGTFDVQKLHDMLNAQGKGMGQAFAFHTGKAKHRFEVNADGSIEVSIRKGDSEMAQSFKNEADLAQRRPDLYEKYEAVKAADQE